MTLEKVAEVLSEQLGIDKSKITLNSRIIEDLGADSLDVVELIMSLEEKYGISISDEEAAKTTTVGDVVALIDKKAK